MKTWMYLGLVSVLAACGDKAGNTGDGGSAATGEAGTTSQMMGECNLVEDTGGPGKYADTCVKREWIEDYAGTYSSEMCVLEVDVSGAAPALFTLEIKSGDLAGTYAYEWSGGTGAGNDSYYRFTTDSTFTTDKALNFTAAEKVNASDEASIGFRVENLETTPTFTANYQLTIISPFENTLVECGTLVRD